MGGMYVDFKQMKQDFKIYNRLPQRCYKREQSIKTKDSKCFLTQSQREMIRNKCMGKQKTAFLSHMLPMFIV